MVIIGPAALALDWYYLPSIPNASPGNVERIEVHLDKWEGQPEATAATTDRSHIEAVLRVFESAQRASEHKCAETGTITFHKKGASTVTIEILPGHDPRYFEYRYAGRINRVHRENLIAALQDIGIDQIWMGFPE